MLKSMIEKFKAFNSYKKRGVIYMTVAILFMAYEFIFKNPPRLPVLLLWFGLIVISVFIITTLKDPRH